MPKVTLLRDEFSDYTLVIGANPVTLLGGKSREVSPAIAIACKKLNEGLPEPLFAIEDMPEVVDKPTVQNVAGMPRQPVMVPEKWL